MTRTLFALSLATVFAMASTAFAQTFHEPVTIGSGVNNSVVVEPATSQLVPADASTFSYDYYGQPETAPPTPSEVPPAPQGSSSYSGCGGCDGCGGCCGCYDYCDDYDPCDCCRWSLFDNSCSCWEIGGWISAGGTMANRNPVSKHLDPLRFNDRNEELHLNQLWLYAEKTVDGCCGWEIGGRADIMWGTDRRYTEAVGWEQNQDGSNRLNSEDPDHLYGIAVPQFYAEIGNANASLIVGHYYTLIGYEVVPANGNFFYSHSYTMLYAEPFTHTGVLGRYAWNDRTQLYLGVNNKWDTVDAVEDKASVLAGFTWESCDCRTSLSAFVTSGDETNSLAVETNRTMYSLVASHWINPCLQYVIQHDNGWQENDQAGGAKDAEWYGINQYLFYTVNDCWKTGVRFEWFRDDDGTRVSDVHGTGIQGDYYEVSLGANWTPNCNLTVRPELRFDWYEGTSAFKPFFDDDVEDNMVTASIDFIFTY